MSLASIIVLLAVAAALVKSIVAPGSERPATGMSLAPKHSEYEQLRIEDHRSIEKSVAPPRG